MWALRTMPMRDMEVPGLIPDTGEVELAPKEARRGRQRGTSELILDLTHQLYFLTSA